MMIGRTGYMTYQNCQNTAFKAKNTRSNKIPMSHELIGNNGYVSEKGKRELLENWTGIIKSDPNVNIEYNVVKDPATDPYFTKFSDESIKNPSREIIITRKTNLGDERFEMYYHPEPTEKDPKQGYFYVRISDGNASNDDWKELCKYDVNIDDGYNKSLSEAAQSLLDEVKYSNPRYL